ncbi:MAG: radical SAM protein [Armatimonadota bacterium]
MRVRLSQVARQYATDKAVHGLLSLLASETDRKALWLARQAEKIAPAERQKEHIRWLGELFKNGHPALHLAQRVLNEAHPNCRDKLVANLFVRNSWLGEKRRQVVSEELGFRPPQLLVISPTMRCNLNCYGCYSGAYSKQEELEPELFDRIIREAKELGIHFFTISGGEPLLRPDLLTLAQTHADCVFHVYTNGTLIDAQMAERLVELGNVYPAISVEGYQEQTDGRRGPGTWERIMTAMRELRERGGIFGFSGTVTRHNADLLASLDYVDFLIEQGCYFGWMFIYIPIGRKPDLELMPTPEQRRRCRQMALEVRRTRPVFVADFWDDGPLVGGCMAGGKVYCHINNRGDVEPCVFVHFSVDNVRDKPLADCLNSEFFRHIRGQIPYHDNLLRPCMIIDNPHVLREAVGRHGACSTDGGGEALLRGCAAALDDYAARHGALADQAWEEGYEWAKDGGLLGAQTSDRS